MCFFYVRMSLFLSAEGAGPPSVCQSTFCAYLKVFVPHRISLRAWMGRVREGYLALYHKPSIL